MTQTNVRVARPIRTAQGALIRTEVLGEMFCNPHTEQGNRNLAKLRSDLEYAQAEEPEAGWRLEARGIMTNWHPWGA